VSLYIRPQCIVHAGLPALASCSEVLHHLGTVSHRYRYFGRLLLWASLAGQANFALRPKSLYRRRIVGVVWALRIIHLVRCGRNGCRSLFLAKGRGLRSRRAFHVCHRNDRKSIERRHCAPSKRIRLDRAKPRSEPFVGRARGELTEPPRKYVFGKWPGWSFCRAGERWKAPRMPAGAAGDAQSGPCWGMNPGFNADSRRAGFSACGR
jgi:hypothetical protein